MMNLCIYCNRSSIASSPMRNSQAMVHLHVGLRNLIVRIEILFFPSHLPVTRTNRRRSLIDISDKSYLKHPDWEWSALLINDHWRFTWWRHSLGRRRWRDREFPQDQYWGNNGFNVTSRLMFDREEKKRRRSLHYCSNKLIWWVSKGKKNDVLLRHFRSVMSRSQSHIDTQSKKIK